MTSVGDANYGHEQILEPLSSQFLPLGSLPWKSSLVPVNVSSSDRTVRLVGPAVRVKRASSQGKNDKPSRKQL